MLKKLSLVGHWMLTAFVAVAMYGLAFALPSCATLETEVGPRLAQGTDAYCLQVRELRLVTRATADRVLKEAAAKKKQMQPAKIRIWCPGDPDYPAEG